MARIDKLIVTNVSALHSKYGSSGLSAIRAAVDAMIAADAVRAAKRLYRRVRLQRATPTAVHSVSGSLPPRNGVKRIVVVSATVERGRIVRLRRMHSR